MKADATAQREDIKAKINKRTDQLDAKAAAKDADWAEDDAADQPATGEWRPAMRLETPHCSVNVWLCAR